ncbi:hypothetical protein UY3_13961 [Chelonia mydas]|uniref:Uncharacterized protein n=1 Tax=Chelonia mydas TaxID=8469 RepID=M7BL69_CHEMY|nr:hypothetical protein UY3_13961 [Chelonia mydas]
MMAVPMATAPSGTAMPAPMPAPPLIQHCGKAMMLRCQSPSPRYRSPAPLGSASPWSASEYSSESEAESSQSRCSHYRSRSQHRFRHHRPGEQAAPVATWLPQWQGPVQCLFWTPWAYHQVQGQGSRPVSVVSGPRAPPSASSMAHRSPRALEDLTQDVTVYQPQSATAPTSLTVEATQPIVVRAPELPCPASRHPEGQEDLVPGTSSFSSPDEAVAGTSTALPPMDVKGHQDLLRRRRKLLRT